MTQLQDRKVPSLGFLSALFTDARLAPLWLIVRLYVGWEWLTAGWEKVTDPAGVWVGAKAGVAITGFLKGALAKTGGEHPAVQGWYGSFISHFALPNATLFSHLVAYGEVLVGIGLILGIFTGLAAFFGGVMNWNYLMAGTVSTNAILLLLSFFLVAAWKVAGLIGGDFVVLPFLASKTTKANSALATVSAND